MRLGPALRVRPALARTVTVIDLGLAALLVFLVFPVALYISGLALVFVFAETGALRNGAELLMGIGSLGTFTWIGAPFAVVIGWFATRTGWIGWAAAPICGLAGAVLLGVATIIVEGDTVLTNEAYIIPIFMPFGAVFGCLGWIALRYLRPDIYTGDTL